MSEQFKQWALGFSGCDGGDMGSPQAPSIWACGIEWGVGVSLEYLKEAINADVRQMPTGYDDWKENTAYRFNWQLMKLFSAISGGSVDDYKKFAEDKKPFIKNEKGFCKINLFPVAFKNTNHELWVSGLSTLTGFASKQEYIDWCQEYRLPEIRKWVKDAKPRLIICLGKTYIDKFNIAFFDPHLSFNSETFEGERELKWGRNSDGTLVVVLPFMVNRNSLNKNTTIQRIGERIGQLLN